MSDLRRLSLLRPKSVMFRLQTNLSRLFLLVGLVSASASGALGAALVQSNATASNLPSNSSQAVAFNSNTVAGNTIFVFVQYYNPAVTTAVSDNCGDTFTEIAGAPISSGTSGTADWFIARNVAGGACTITASYASATS
jgi:hypothetical protein